MTAQKIIDEWANVVRRQNRYYARQKDRGRCLSCPERVVVGRVRCRKHLDINKQRKQREGT